MASATTTVYRTTDAPPSPAVRITSSQSTVENLEAMWTLELKKYNDNPDKEGRLDFKKRVAICEKYDDVIPRAKAAEAAIAILVGGVKSQQTK